jgi:hypothetical protein
LLAFETRVARAASAGATHICCRASHIRKFLIAASADIQRRWIAAQHGHHATHIPSVHERRNLIDDTRWWSAVAVQDVFIVALHERKALRVG